MEATTQEFPLKLTKIQEVEVTSKIDEPMKAQEVEESTKINEQSNFQDLNACKLYLRSQRFKEKESLKDQGRRHSQA